MTKENKIIAGTLTQNKMTASHLVYDSSEHDILTNFDSIDRESESFQALCNVAILCSRASFINGKLHFVMLFL